MFVRNSNVPKYSVILTLSKNITTLNIQITKLGRNGKTSHGKTKKKRSSNVIPIHYANVPQKT